jgi:selenocysteine lyase/cysteine desulfurase
MNLHRATSPPLATSPDSPSESVYGLAKEPGLDRDFLAEWPKYESTRKLDDLRRREYSGLDRLGHLYLDYTGAGLFAISQMREHVKLIESDVFGNPHSRNPTSAVITELVEQCRRAVLAHFNAPESEYIAIFTAKASQALKLVGEAFPFDPESQFLLTFDNHNSVNGIREFARAAIKGQLCAAELARNARG